jgi:hypothetical protein
MIIYSLAKVLNLPGGGELHIYNNLTVRELKYKLQRRKMHLVVEHSQNL